MGGLLGRVAILGASIVWCSTGWAQDVDVVAEEASQPERDEEARMLFEAGRRAFSDGRFAEALDRYTRSHELSGRTILLFNIAGANDRLGRAEDAALNYRAYLEAHPDAENRNFIESRLVVLDGQIAEQRERDSTESPPTETDVTEPAPPDSSRSLVGPLALLSTGAAAVVVALATGLRANGLYDDLESSCPMSRCSADRRGDADKMDRMALTTDVMVGVAAAAALAGTLWWILGSDDDEQVRASASCFTDGCSGSLWVGF